MRYFVVGATNVTNEETLAFLDGLRESVGWWHWLPEMWLLVTPKDYTASKLRDLMHEKAPKAHIVVLEVDPVTWSTHGPQREGASISEWINKNWKKEP